RLVEWEIEHLFGFANLDAMTRLSAIRVQQRERGGESKERSRRGGLLGLFNRDAGQLSLVVVRAGNLDLRMALFVNPLVEEPFEIPPSCVFAGAFQIAGDDVAAAMAAAIEIQRFVEQRVSQFPPQHVQD